MEVEVEGVRGDSDLNLDFEEAKVSIGDGLELILFDLEASI